MAVDHILSVIKSEPGVQRDGTQYNSKNYIDGQWCRFYMGLPRKIGGYSLLDQGNYEVVRNMFEYPGQNLINIYLGRPSSLAICETTVDGQSDAEVVVTPSGFTPSIFNQWTFDTFTVLSNPTVYLNNNPLSVTSGSGTVTVTIPSTSSLTNGGIVQISGATDTGGIAASNLNITTAITLTGSAPWTSFTYTANHSQQATSTTTGGGNNIAYDIPGTATFIAAVATQSVNDINSNIQSPVYASPSTSYSPFTPISSSTTVTTSGGIVSVHPYFFLYGNDGTVTWTLFPNGNWEDAQVAAIDTTKIVKGLRTRGGSGAPAALFWSLTSLIRATFIGGATVFDFDTIQDDITVLSSNAIVTFDNIFMWPGVNRFFIYNSVVKPLPNTMSTDYFFNNLNYDQRQKVWAWVNYRYNEVWIHYPTQGNAECTNILIYNYQLNTWYDSILGRTAGVEANFYPYPVLADATHTLNQFEPPQYTTVSLSTNPITTVAGTNIIQVQIAASLGISTGDSILIQGSSNVGGIMASQINVRTPVTRTNTTTLTFPVSTAATSSVTGGGASVMLTYQSNLSHALWTHEYGTDIQVNNQFNAIPSWFETNIIAWFDNQPQNDRQMRVRRVEPDFNMTGAMTLTVNSRDFAQGPVTSSNPYTFLPSQPQVVLDKIDTINMGRLVSFRFESNVVGGYYQMGKVLLNYAAGDVYP